METNTAKTARTDQWQAPEPGIEDRLGSLPDEIITHILSFLETKYAVGTAVLSRRWKDLWARVSNLDFDNCLVYRDLISSGDVDKLQLKEMRKRRDLEFCRFVGKVLTRHRNLDSLRRFRLHILISKHNWKVMQDHLDTSGLVFGSEVEEIDVMLFQPMRYLLPDCIWWLPESFYTLKNLKVVNCRSARMAAMGSVSLPSVKILRLQEVEIKDLELLGRLISGCPVLETLHLENCCFKCKDRADEEFKLIASLPFLRNLSIVDWHCQCLCPIAVEAPNLEHLYLVGFSELQFLGSSPLPCIHSVLVDSPNDRERQCLIKLLTQVSNAKDVCLTGATIELLQDIEDIQLSVFPNLTHLTISICHCPCWFLHSLLHSVPNLPSLVVKPMIESERMMSEETEPTCTWHCLLSSLEKIKIKDFVPFKNDVKMVGYLLSAGAVLKKVDIHIYDNITKRKCKKLASLLTLPRESSACDVRLLLRGSKISMNIENYEINTDDEDENEEEDEDEDEDENEDED